MLFRSLANHPIIFCRGFYQADGYYFQISSGGAFYFITNQAGANQATETAAGRILVNTWYILGVTRAGAVVKLYRNGVDVTDISGSHINPKTCTRTPKIGIYDDKSSNAFNDGLIGEVLAYNRTLNPLEMQHNDLATKWRCV